MDLQYPIGEFAWGPSGEGLLSSEAERAQWIVDLEEAPVRLRAAVGGLTEAQLDTPYRPEGWTVRQVVHHLADSHMNSYIRFRLALTEENPLIKTYDQELWANLSDARTAPIGLSLALLDNLHHRIVLLLGAVMPQSS